MTSFEEGDPSQYIPLQSKAVYLGAIISYSNYETQTVQHRIQQARHRHWALTKILHKRHGMRESQRIDMWRSCIWSSMSYALSNLKLSETHIKRLHITVLKHIRAITSKPVHISRISDQQLLDSLGLDTPFQSLLKQVENDYKRQKEHPCIASSRRETTSIRCRLHWHLRLRVESREQRETCLCQRPESGDVQYVKEAFTRNVV